MKMASRILIGGGTGFVGKHLKKALLDEGFTVSIISRQAGPGRMTWKDISRSGIPDDCTGVVNLSGQNILNPLKRWNESFKEEVRSSRIDTTKTLASAVAQAKHVKVFSTISGVAAYRPDKTKEYTELSPAESFDFLSQLVLDWEDAAKLPESLNVRQFTVRSGVVLGRDGGMIQQVYYPFFFGVGGKIGSGSQWLPWIHVTDLVGIFTHGLKNDSVTGVLNGVAPEAGTNLDFTNAFAKALGRPACIPVFEFVMNTVYGTERAKVILEGQKVIPQRTIESGYKFVYPDLKSACSSFV